MRYFIVGTSAYGCDMDLCGPLLTREEARIRLEALVASVESSLDRFIWTDDTVFDRDALVAFRIDARDGAWA